MCARVDQSQFSLVELERRALRGQSRREVFPRQQLAFLRAAAGRKSEAVAGYWGLVHRDALAINKKVSTFNARAETVDNLPTFRDSFKDRRAVIPLDGFYEWADKITGKPQLMGICSMEPGPLWAAGLWEWNEALQLTSVTMITTESNKLVAQVHSRMPVLLAPADVPAWLAQGGKDLLRPSSAKLAMMYMDSMPSWEGVRANQARLDAARAAGAQAGENMGGAWRPPGTPG